MKPRRYLLCLRGHVVAGDNALPIGNHYACRKCHSDACRERYYRNIEQRRAYQREYARRQREAARQ